MTGSIASQITTALATRDREAQQSAAQLAWRAILADAFGTGEAFDVLAVGAALATIGRDTTWFARTVRQLRLVMEGERAEAPGGDVERAKDAFAEVLQDMATHDAEVKRLEAELAAAKRKTFDLQTRQLNALRAQEAARQIVTTAQERQNAVANDETLRHVGGFSWLAARMHDARQAAKAKAAAAGGAS